MERQTYGFAKMFFACQAIGPSYAVDRPPGSDREKVAPLVAQPFCVNPIWLMEVEQIYALSLYRKRCRL